MKISVETKAYTPITLATYFTLLRIVCVPSILVFMLNSAWFAATAIFVIASITDVIDGMLARSLNQVSALGTILDPLADKLLSIAVYTGLVYGQSTPIPLPVWFLVFVLVSELLLMLATLYWSLLKQKVLISPSWLAKLVGVGQFLFIFWSLLSAFVGTVPLMLFYQILLLLTIARICVLTQYCIRTYTSTVSNGMV